MDSPLIQARKASRDPKDCLSTIDALRAIGFFDDGGDAFKRLHHQGGSVTRFSSYSRGVGQYEDDDNNHRVHQRLTYVLLSCTNGPPPKEERFLTLTKEAMKLIPPMA
jgi:hypothetical protein